MFVAAGPAAPGAASGAPPRRAPLPASPGGHGGRLVPVPPHRSAGHGLAWHGMAWHLRSEAALSGAAEGPAQAAWPPGHLRPPPDGEGLRRYRTSRSARCRLCISLRWFLPGSRHSGQVAAQGEVRCGEEAALRGRGENRFPAVQPCSPLLHRELLTAQSDLVLKKKSRKRPPVTSRQVPRRSPAV